MRHTWITLVLLLSCPIIDAQDSPQYSAKGLSFKLNDLAITQGVLGAQMTATLLNQTEHYWHAMSVNVTVSVECEGKPKRIKFDALVGTLIPGKNALSATSFSQKKPCMYASTEKVELTALSPLSAPEEQLEKDYAKSLENVRRAEESLARLKAEQAADREKKRQEAEHKCHEMYASIGDKKTSDLTVTEAGLVQACRSLGVYN